MTDASSSSSSSLSPSLLPLTPPSSPVVLKDPRYQRGKVYEIVLLHEDYKDETYVGSTICPKLSTRFGQHKIEAEKEEQTKKLHVLMKTIGVRFFKIVLIEDWPCNNRQELSKREQYHINLRKPTLNMKKAHITMEEEKAYLKNYRAENKVAISALSKVYRAENKVAISAQKKAYAEANKESISAYQKAYAQENKVALSAYQKVYAEEHKVDILAYHKAYKEKNKLAISALGKDYYEKNKEKIKAYQRARKAKAKLAYKDKVVLAVKEALALRAERRRNEQEGKQ